MDSNAYAGCNNAELALLTHEARTTIDKLEVMIKAERTIINDIASILEQRLVESGATAIATPHGTIHTVSRTTARIMDPVQCIAFLESTGYWKEALDLKMNSVWCRTHMEETQHPIPGVELATHRHLRITAPKPQRTSDV